MTRPRLKPWPPGFVPQLVPESRASQKKSVAATKARDRRATEEILKTKK